MISIFIFSCFQIICDKYCGAHMAVCSLLEKTLSLIYVFFKGPAILISSAFIKVYTDLMEFKKTLKLKQSYFLHYILVSEIKIL